MRYLILVIAFITVLFTANSLMDGYFAKEKERRIWVEGLENVQTIMNCNRCNYVENEMYFKDGHCPRCGNKIGG